MEDHFRDMGTSFQCDYSLLWPNLPALFVPHDICCNILGTHFSDAFKEDIGTAKGLENFCLGEMLVLPQDFGFVRFYI